jgi:hypothetical protein
MLMHIEAIICDLLKVFYILKHNFLIWMRHRKLPDPDPDITHGIFIILVCIALGSDAAFPH